MKIEISNNIIQMALEAHLIQQSGSINSTEGRSREVERRQNHVCEIIIWIITNEYRKQRILPYVTRNTPK